MQRYSHVCRFFLCVTFRPLPVKDLEICRISGDTVSGIFCNGCNQETRTCGNIPRHSTGTSLYPMPRLTQLPCFFSRHKHTASVTALFFPATIMFPIFGIVICVCLLCRDVMWQGTTDDGCVALADLLGWKVSF